MIDTNMTIEAFIQDLSKLAEILKLGIWVERGRTFFNDRNGTEILKGDTVRGLFYLGNEIKGVCDYSSKDAAWGIRWKRGGAEEFTPFCSCCNVEWEVEND